VYGHIGPGFREILRVWAAENEIELTDNCCLCDFRSLKRIKVFLDVHCRLFNWSGAEEGI
jgi:ABC-type tungstate transport system permease subunit